ncbi:MAG TPA: cytochrome c oxidase subunit II [Thermoleophilia bacterium]|nr:cytochrome c oxidase subunit II [Thermoleophilia bacterium]
MDRASGPKPARERGRQQATRIVWRALAVAAPLCVASALLLAGCGRATDTPSVFRPEGTGGQHIVTLATIMFSILAGVLLTVWIILTYVIIRYRKRPESEASKTRGNTTIEIVWTAIPAVIVAVLFGLTVAMTGAISLGTKNVTFTATGHQWWWALQYSGATFETANEIHVPVDRTVTANLLSADVIHSYWVPQMGGKVDLIPGHVNRVSFLPVKTGRYLGVCSEFCGKQHANMRFLLFVQTPTQFAQWFANQVKPAAAPVSPQAKAGAAVIGTLACGGCHTIRGTSLKGTYGPDLTHLASRSTIAAVTLLNTPPNLSHWIADPQGVKPGTYMPQITVPPQTLDQIVAYLSELQ